MFADYPLPAGRDECPSELKFDQLSLGELGARSVGGLRYHIGHCARCQRRAALREAGLTAFPKLDGAALLARLEDRLLEKAAPPKKTRWKLWALCAAGAVALTASLILMLV